MNDAFAIDASALLAMLNVEPGGQIVATVIGASIMSAVNWSEVLQKTGAHGVATDGLTQEMQALGLEIVPFDIAIAAHAAALWAAAPSISLADRACLATARAAGLRALTADRAWKDLDIGVTIESIR